MLGCFVVFALGRTDFVEGWTYLECFTRHTASLAHFLSIWPETALENIKNVSYLAIMPGSVTANEAARLLGTSKPTVRALIARGHLQASREPRGKLFTWRIDEPSVRRWLDEHGRYDKQSRGGRSRLAKLEAEVSALREAVRALASGSQSAAGVNRASYEERERDDLRAHIVSLEEALARAHLVAELQRDADAERAAIISRLLEAMAASERADALRRRAVTELEEALQAFSRPGHAAEII